LRCVVLQGIQPEVRTYNTIITACNKSGKPEEGLKIYERMVAAGVKASATTYTALISAYGKQGKVEKAMEIFAGGPAVRWAVGTFAGGMAVSQAGRGREMLAGFLVRTQLVVCCCGRLHPDCPKLCHYV
jgi:pentatricopeptide repeat protein